jgi:hypothetical protein
MLLPVLISLGSRILGWDAVDIDTVMHVRAPLCPSVSNQHMRNFYAAMQFCRLNDTNMIHSFS